MKSVAFVFVALSVVACKGNDKPKVDPPTATSTAGSAVAPPAPASCASQASELKTWIASVMDASQKVGAPWPTGEATFDADLDKLRADARARAKPADPAKPAEPLVEGVTPNRLDAELASCPQASEQIKAISNANPSDLATAWAGIADAIAACDCKPSVARVKALIYLAQRGPD